MPSYDRALWALRVWLDSWLGIGHVAVGMHRQGFDLQLTQYDERGWRATFYAAGDGAFPDEREPCYCGDLDGAVERDRVWVTCTCGAVINRSADDD
jgi:hypothetical protein